MTNAAKANMVMMTAACGQLSTVDKRMLMGAEQWVGLWLCQTVCYRFCDEGFDGRGGRLSTRVPCACASSTMAHEAATWPRW